MYQRALQGKEKALGMKHTSILDTVNNLGKLYWNKASSTKLRRCICGRCEALMSRVICWMMYSKLSRRQMILAASPTPFVPSISEYLLGHGELTSTDYSKIMTSIAQKCMTCSRSISRSAIDAEQERLRDFEKSESDHMAAKRRQMDMCP